MNEESGLRSIVWYKKSNGRLILSKEQMFEKNISLMISIERTYYYYIIDVGVANLTMLN
jgi:hypothetical protein